MSSPEDLPDELWKLISEHAAAMVIQKVVRRRLLARLHYGHVHEERWTELRSLLDKKGVLRRMYPFPLTRREWRTEMSSWWPDVDAALLVKDMEECNNWGHPSPMLKLSR